MTIYQYDGWDFYANGLATDFYASGTEDYANIWSAGTSGTTVKRQYPTGYYAGQGLVPMSGTQPFTTAQTTIDVTSLRTCWYGYLQTVQTSPSFPQELCKMTQGVGTCAGLVETAHDSGAGTATLSLAIFTGTGDYAGTAAGSTLTVRLDEWHHYELFVDVTNNYVRLYQDGNEMLNIDGDLTSSNNIDGFQFRSPENFADEWIWDHMIVYDGASLINSVDTYAAVGVMYGSGAKDSVGTPTTQYKGKSFIVVNGTTYDGDTRGNLLTYGGGGNTYCPKLISYWQDFWEENPDTSAAWGSDLSGVTNFGVCRTDSNDAGSVLLFPTVAVTYIKIVDGFPLVLIQPPTNSIELPTPADWEKTNAAVDWGDTVANHPRTDPINDWPSAELTADPFVYTPRSSPEEYIGAIGPSCIGFDVVIDPPDTDGAGTVYLSFAEEYRTDYLDWQTVTALSPGVDFESYFITGYRIPGGGDKNAQGNYITINYRTDTDGSCYVQGIFDYATTGNTGRWGTTQQVYGPTNSTDYTHAFRKLKMRGHGRALQMKFKSESGKPFYINGWAMFVTANKVV